MKVTKEKVAEIKADILAGKLNQIEIGKKHGLSRSAVSDIATNRTHKDVAWGSDPPANKPGGQSKRPQTKDEKILTLEAENIHLKEEFNACQRTVKSAKRQHGIFQAVVTELANYVPTFPSKELITFSKDKTKIQESLVMHISDGHHDEIVLPEDCQGIEEYNFEISCRRAERYVDTTLEFTQQTLKPSYQFRTLYVLAYGDFTSGEIHPSRVRLSAFKNQFNNCLAIGQLHARMLQDLHPHFENVVVAYVPGNHGRRTPEKDYYGAWDNWDYLIAKIAQQHCADLPNVHFLIPNSFSINLVIEGIGFSILHGDDIMGQGGIPFYGLIRRQKNIIAMNAIQNGPRIRYISMGHHHVSAALADFDGELLINGAWLGTDAYAFNKFGGYREPCQLLHGVHAANGVTWRLPVKLRTKNEKDGPTRYKISI